MTTSRMDFLGIASASLCVIHCLATPFLIVLVSKYEWWENLTFIFLAISFFAVYQATKSRPPAYILAIIWIGFFALSTGILLEESWQYGEMLGYAASLILVLGHVLNIRHCKKCAHA